VIKETGRIVAIDSDCLWVETIQGSTCGNCSAQKGCGQSMVAKWSGKTVHIPVLLGGRSPDSFSLHEDIEIGIPEHVIVRGSLFVYLCPLFCMVAGMLLAEWLLGSELVAIVGAVAGLLLGGLVVRGHSNRHRLDHRVQPVIIDNQEPLQWSSQSGGRCTTGPLNL
jgi:sigma-E factor negative regulatory protein RseC